MLGVHEAIFHNAGPRFCFETNEHDIERYIDI
jgi:hypothetical protein